MSTPTWVNEANTELLAHFEDANGFHATMRWWLAGAVTDITATPVTAILNAVKACSDCALLSAELIQRSSNTTPGTPTGTGYPTAKDKQKLELLSADGSRHIVEVPAPSSGSTFYNNNNLTVKDDLTSDPWNLLIYGTGGILASQVDPEGNALTALTKNYRMRPKGIKNQL